MARSAAVASPGTPAPRYPSLHRLCSLERERFGVPGFVIASVGPSGPEVFVDGWSDPGARTGIDASHLFQIGSITKSMVALAAFRLAQQGKLDLDAPIEDYLKGLSLPTDVSIRLTHLLSHTSGLPDAAPRAPRGETRLWVGFAPGSRYRYSNGAYGLAGDIIEAVSDTSLDIALRQLIFEPLGMTTATGRIDARDRHHYAAGYAAQAPDRPWWTGQPIVPAPWVDFVGGAGSVAATGADMARYLAWLVDAGRGQGDPLLDQRWLARFLSPVIAVPGRPEGTFCAHGLLLDRKDGHITALHHTGSMLGFTSAMHVRPDDGVAGFAGANLVLDSYRPTRVARHAAALRLTAAAGEPLPALPHPAAVADASDFAGRFTAAGGARLQLAARGERLLLQTVDGDLPLQTTREADMFAVPHRDYADFPLGFERDGGKVVSAFHGGVRYRRGDVAPPAEKARFTALTGSYFSENPWRGTVRVVEREGRLWLNGTAPLSDLGGGLFREGAEAWSPERVRFDAIVNGRASRLIRSGTDYLRVSLHD